MDVSTTCYGQRQTASYTWSKPRSGVHLLHSCWYMHPVRRAKQAKVQQRSCAMFQLVFKSLVWFGFFAFFGRTKTQSVFFFFQKMKRPNQNWQRPSKMVLNKDPTSCNWSFTRPCNPNPKWVYPQDCQHLLHLFVLFHYTLWYTFYYTFTKLFTIHCMIYLSKKEIDLIIFAPPLW